MNSIGGVMVSVLASSTVDRGCEPRSGQIGICCFFAKNTTFRSKSKNWLARNQDNVSEWEAMFIRGMLLQ
jgi:hypothetical protein